MLVFNLQAYCGLCTPSIANVVHFKCPVLSALTLERVLLILILMGFNPMHISLEMRKKNDLLPRMYNGGFGVCILA